LKFNSAPRVSPGVVLVGGGVAGGENEELSGKDIR
jgi:hypothetical protein